MYSSVTVVGHVGSSAELRYTPSGGAVCNFSVATSRRYKKNEEVAEETTWYKIVLWGKVAEALAQYIVKGTLVLVEGQLVPDENGNPKIYTGKDGQPHSSFEIRAKDIKLLGKSNKEESSQESEEL